MAVSLPAMLAVLSGLFFSTILGQYRAYQRQTLLFSDFFEDITICKNTPVITKAQKEICYQQPDAVAVALQGLSEAVKECQHQFHSHRWNCSSLSTKTKNIYSSTIFKKGFRETAFAYAMSSAGVAISIAKACSQGLLMNCGCDTHKYKMRKGRSHSGSAWKWVGCSHNVHYGMKFSKMFLDSRENGADIHSEVNLHNNNVGRLAVAGNMQVKCKCHGLSGSCELKTCWRAVPDLRVVGRTLKEKYKAAVLVYQSNLANRDSRKMLDNKNLKERKKKKRLKLRQWTPQRRKQKRGLKNELLYYEKSPNFCESNLSLDVLGTAGRFCNRTSSDQGSCSSLCCGRGYNLVKQRITRTCNCIFHWCCTVECQNCTTEEWISICK